MSRLKQPLILLLSAAILVLGGLLPGFVGKLQDRYREGRVEFAPVHAVQLEFEDTSMTLRQKLALLGESTSAIQVSTDMTQHTTAEIWQIAMNTAETYRQAGLIPTTLSPADIAYCVPKMVYWESHREDSQVHSNIFWELSVSDGGGGENALSMVVDDRTGTVCTIRYQNVAVPRAEENTLEKMLEIFCGMALEELGEEFGEYDPKQLAREAVASGSVASYAAAQIAWEDSIHGEVRMAFVVSDVGFYTYTF